MFKVIVVLLSCDFSVWFLRFGVVEKGRVGEFRVFWGFGLLVLCDFFGILVFRVVVMGIFGFGGVV